MAKRTLSRLDIKQAILTDVRFRKLFPELKQEIDSILKNPTCACNVPMFDKFFRHKDRLRQYFSNREIKSPGEPQEDKGSHQNHWTVIDCHVDELERKLNELHKVGQKQVAVARYEDRIVMIVNDLGVMF